MTYEVIVVIRQGPAATLAPPVEFATPPLPSYMPPIEVRTARPSVMEPGWTMFVARSAALPILVVVDEEGRIRWWHREAGVSHKNGFVVRRNGNILFESDFFEVHERDWLGNEVARWHATETSPDNHPDPTSIPVEAEAFHHELREMPNGNVLTLGVELRAVENYPTGTSSASATQTASVAADVVLEFSDDGMVVNAHRLLDILDPTRIGYGSLGGFWNAHLYQDSKDWSHANSAFYDEASDAFIVSVRHQDAVVKIARGTGELIWILGTHQNWGPAFADKLLTPSGVFEWPFHQHDARITPAGGIGMFDNGNGRAAPPDPEITDGYSRAVEYMVDETNMTVTQTFSDGPTQGAERIYSAALGSAVFMPETNNVLITSGNEVSDSGDFGALIIEVDRDHNRVFEIAVTSTSAGWSVYRAERISDLRR